MDFKEPLFHIHINADYPLNFKGILYFPKINHEYDRLEGQVKLFYTVNGFISGETVSDTDTYRFHVETDLFSEDEECRPVKCSVISNGGIAIKHLEGDLSSIDFEIKSESAAYFYLRFHA